MSPPSIEHFRRQPRECGLTASRAFEDLTTTYLDLRWQFDPVQATAAGLSDYDQRLGSFGSQSIEENLAALRSIAHAVEELSIDTIEDELDRTALLNQIRVTVNRYTHKQQVQSTEEM